MTAFTTLIIEVNEYFRAGEKSCVFILHCGKNLVIYYYITVGCV